MPCYLVVSVQISDLDPALAHKAALELGLVDGRDYSLSGKTLSLSDPAKRGTFLQRYGLLKAESAARIKGYKTQRSAKENGVIQLTITA